MSNIIEFKLSNSKSIKLCLPCEEEKISPYVNVSIKYINSSDEYELFINDFIIEAIKSFNYLLTKALNFELQINNEYIEKGIGFYHNIYSHELWTNDDLDIDDPAETFSVWSTPSYIGIETYIYNIQDQINLEISPIYKWNSDYPDDDTEYQTFEEYIKQHQIIDVINIKRDTALEWQKKCSEILEILNQK